MDKNWKTKIIDIPCLRLELGLSLPSMGSFPKSVYATILARDAHNGVCDSDLKIWVNASIQRGLENIHMEMSIAGDIEPRLTSRMLSWKTLVVLKLNGLDIDAFSFVNFPSLKTLHLNDVAFPEPQYLLELLSRCPILEHMQLRDMYYPKPSSSTPSYKNFKSLSKLVRADLYDSGLDIPLKAICKLELLFTDKYSDDFPVFPNFTHLLLESVRRINWHLVLAMLKQCSRLQVFFLSDMPGSLADTVWPAPHFVPECLSSQLRKCSIEYYHGTPSQLHFAKYIMQNSGVLQTMTIYAKYSSCKLGLDDFTCT